MARPMGPPWPASRSWRWTVLFGWHSGVVLEPKWDPANKGMAWDSHRKIGNNQQNGHGLFYMLGRLWEYYYYIHIYIYMYICMQPTKMRLYENEMFRPNFMVTSMGKAENYEIWG
jgi:hypothetical protein